MVMETLENEETCHPRCVAVARYILPNVLHDSLASNRGNVVGWMKFPFDIAVNYVVSN